MRTARMKDGKGTKVDEQENARTDTKWSPKDQGVARVYRTPEARPKFQAWV